MAGWDPFMNAAETCWVRTTGSGSAPTSLQRDRPARLTWPSSYSFDGRC